jgi:hypothetical protein
MSGAVNHGRSQVAPSKQEFETRVTEAIGRVEAIILDALGLAAPSVAA